MANLAIGKLSKMTKPKNDNIFSQINLFVGFFSVTYESITVVFFNIFSKTKNEKSLEKYYDETS
jgi:hypothetical protein